MRYITVEGFRSSTSCVILPLVFSSTYLLICSLACSVLLRSVLKPSDW
uniref:Uncharacterized protein n=1 Tax=Anguilla anguilla TaxID=7936 RepID=A0A0E9T8P7_ANGAN